MIKDLGVTIGSIKFFHYSLIIKANLKFDFGQEVLKFFFVPVKTLVPCLLPF